MADAPPNSGGLAVDPPVKVKKRKAAKGSRKPRSECMPEEISQMDTKSAKRRNRRAAIKGKTAAAKFAAERDAVEPRGARSRSTRRSHRQQSAHPPNVAFDVRRISLAFQSLEAFKARNNDKPFTLAHCWTLINNCSKFKDQYHELQRKRGKKAVAFAGDGDGEALKRPRRKLNSKVDDIRDASSMALHETLHSIMSQKDVRDEKRRQSKEEQMKLYLELQRKKLEMEEAAKKRKIDMKEASRQRQLDIEAANVTARQRQLDIEATNASTKAKEMALAIMSVDLTKISEKMRSWFEARQKEMFDADGLN
ncbi:hypothetical protein VPH35_032060 [Triticum aestivum]